MVAVAKKTAAAAKAAKADGPKMIGSVDMSKVKREVLVKYAVQLKVGTDKDTDEQLVKALSAKFAKLGVSRLADCTNCGGDSDRELDACPFCGDANEDEEGDDESASDDDDQDAASGSDDDEASSDASSTSVSDAASASIDDDPEEVAASNARAAAAPASAIAGVGGGRRRKATASAALATTSSVHQGEIVDVPQHTEKDFDEAVKRVQYLKGEPMVSLWRLGAEIKVIFDKQLWKQRNKEGGGAAYTSFNQCVIKELGFTVQNAYWLMDVSANYNEAQVREFGTSKLGTILAAPKEARARLLEMAKGGASVRQLRSAVNEEREKAGTEDEERETGRRKKPRKKGAKSAKAKAAKKATLAPTITVAAILGRHTVNCFKSAKPDVKATKIGDQPSGYLNLENGVRMHFIVTTTPAGNVVIRVEVKREE